MLRKYQASDFKCKLSARAMHAISALLTPTEDLAGESNPFWWVKDWNIIDLAFYVNRHMRAQLDYLSSEEYRLSVAKCTVDDFLAAVCSDNKPMVFYEAWPSRHLLPGIVQKFLESTAPLTLRPLTFTLEHVEADLDVLWGDAYAQFFSCSNCSKVVYETLDRHDPSDDCSKHFREVFHINNKVTGQRLTVAFLHSVYFGKAEHDVPGRKFSRKGAIERVRVYMDLRRCEQYTSLAVATKRSSLPLSDAMLDVLGMLDRKDVANCRMVHSVLDQLVFRRGKSLAKYRLHATICRPCSRGRAVLRIGRYPTNGGGKFGRMDAEVRSVELTGASFAGLEFVQAHLRNSFVERIKVIASETTLACTVDLLAHGMDLIEDLQFNALKLLGDASFPDAAYGVSPLADRKLTLEMDEYELESAIFVEDLMTIPQMICAQEIRFVLSAFDAETMLSVMLQLSRDVLRLPRCERMLIRVCDCESSVTADQLAASFIESFELSEVVNTMAKIIDLEVHYHGPETKSALPGKPSLSGVRFALPDSPDSHIRSRKRKCDVYHYKKRLANEWLTAIVKRGRCFQVVRLQRGKWEPAQPNAK